MSIFRPPSIEPSTDSGHDASPEYELEGPRDATHAGGNFHMQARTSHDADALNTESYVFDRRSRSLVRSRSEGHTMLHPYVRHLCDCFDPHFRSDRRVMTRFGYSGHL